MSISPNGFAAMSPEGLDIRTAADDEKMSKLIALHVRGVTVVCTKDGCDCVDRAMADYADDVAIVPVEIRMITHG